jgi:hypothetical protein
VNIEHLDSSELIEDCRLCEQNAQKFRARGRAREANCADFSGVGVPGSDVISISSNAMFQISRTLCFKFC